MVAAAVTSMALPGPAATFTALSVRPIHPTATELEVSTEPVGTVEVGVVM